MFNKIVLKENYTILLFLVVISFLLKILYLYMLPLWRVDSFFYIQGANVITNGGVLYKNFGDIKPPGIFYLYSLLIKLFGYGNIFYSIKISNIFIISLSSFFIFKSGEIIYNKKNGLIIGVLFLLFMSADWHFWPSNIMTVYILPFSLMVYFLLKDKFILNFYNLFLSGIFCGLMFLTSSNTILYLLLYPLLGVFYLRNLVGMIKVSMYSFFGFMVPFGVFLIYIISQNAFNDYFWWSFKWASMYGAQNSIYERFLNFFIGIFWNWEILPVVTSAFIGLVYLIKNKKYNEPYMFFLLILVLITIPVKMILPKTVHRYNIYLIPAFILTIPLIEYCNVKKKYKRFYHVFIIVILFSAYLYNYNYLYKYKLPISRMFNAHQVLVKWIKKNSKNKAKIFIWHEGYNIYYNSKRQMATSFFSPAEHLAKNKIWSRYNERNIEIPWNKFFSELKLDEPELIIDLTGGFKYKMKYKEGEKFKKYYKKFREFLKFNYVSEKNNVGYDIYKRIL